MNGNLCILMDEIERIRIEMHDAAIQKGLMHAETVRISQIFRQAHYPASKKQTQDRKYQYSLYQ
ncbi:hypothetical protein GCM10020331_029210 [Ectobacillus funiculus]